MSVLRGVVKIVGCLHVHVYVLLLGVRSVEISKGLLKSVTSHSILI